MRGRCVDKEQVKSQQADGRGAKGSLWALSIKDGLEYPGASFLEEAILEDRTHSQSTRTQAFKYLCLTTDVSSQMSHHEGMSRRIIPFTQIQGRGRSCCGSLPTTSPFYATRTPTAREASPIPGKIHP